MVLPRVCSPSREINYPQPHSYKFKSRGEGTTDQKTLFLIYMEPAAVEDKRN
jgi:hypothetical protein